MTEEVKPKITLQGVIVKVKAIAADQYEDKVYDNILSIFNQLETSEKRILLKGLINICFIVEDKVLMESATISDVKDAVVEAQQTIHQDINNIENINKIELIKLKTWLVKTGTLLLLGGVIAAILIVLFFNQDGTDGFLENFEFLKRIFEVLKTALGL